MSEDNVKPFRFKKTTTPTLIGRDTENALNWTTPVGTIYGVQLWEDGRLIGTSLYSEQHKAATVCKVLNRKFAELKVNHEAKQINYDVM